MVWFLEAWGTKVSNPPQVQGNVAWQLYISDTTRVLKGMGSWAKNSITLEWLRAIMSNQASPSSFTTGILLMYSEILVSKRQDSLARSRKWAMTKNQKIPATRLQKSKAIGWLRACSTSKRSSSLKTFIILPAAQKIYRAAEAGTATSRTYSNFNIGEPMLRLLLMGGTGWKQLRAAIIQKKLTINLLLAQDFTNWPKTLRQVSLQQVSSNDLLQPLLCHLP